MKIKNIILLAKKAKHWEKPAEEVCFKTQCQDWCKVFSCLNSAYYIQYKCLYLGTYKCDYLYCIIMDIFADPICYKTHIYQKNLAYKKTLHQSWHCILKHSSVLLSTPSHCWSTGKYVTAFRVKANLCTQIPANGCSILTYARFQVHGGSISLSLSLAIWPLG